ncbi:MAG: hypothetical protein ABSF44_12245 [Candidatus Bathyarchaeia archaeon]
MPNWRTIREQSPNGEIHLILPDNTHDETTKTAEDLDKVEIRKIMKKEASKPLLLIRAE